MRPSALLALVAITSLLTLGHCSVMSDLDRIPDLSTTAAALRMSGLDVIVDSLQDVTILAPTNKSWLNLLATLGVSLTELKGGGILHAILKYQIIPRPVMPGDMAPPGGSTSTLLVSGQALRYEVVGSTVTYQPSSGISPASVVDAMELKDNESVLHILDGVLVPAEAFGGASA